MTVDERLAQDFGLWDVVEALLHDVLLDLFEVFDVLTVGELVKVDPVSLVAPEPHDLRRGRDALVAGEEKALEHVGKVAKVEDVVKLDSCWHEHLFRKKCT